ncbi:glycosyltransferase [Candidatus Aerophobetes bacterium]|uniref:Glycosyltransferase n=1 Tax=Aerophobetes bacterium TaxID=2030807 RepID=A0A523S1N6_UNCAE|nr:MAG: glycosyltransferase [Candidatus Aerophobetes bacterium]
MRVLFLTSKFPYPLIGGEAIKAYYYLKYLSLSHEVTLLTFTNHHIEPISLDRIKKLCHSVKIVPRSVRILSWINSGLAILSSKPFQVKYYHSRKMREVVNREINNHKYDLLIVHLIRMFDYVRNYGGCVKIAALEDALSLNYSRQFNYLNRANRWLVNLERKRVFQYEKEIIECSRLCLVVSRVDKSFLEKRTGQADKIRIVPNGVSRELLARGGNKVKEKDWIVFLGNMGSSFFNTGNFPNRDACTFFSTAVFPRLRQKNKGIKFLIVGANPSKEIMKLRKIEGVEVTGFTRDPYYYLERAKIFVAPLRCGAGIQNKILEAMALGKAVVTTQIGAEGIEGENDKHFVIVDKDKPEEMADRVMDLLKNERNRRYIGENARGLIKEKYTWDIIGESFLREVEKITCKV